MHKLAKLFVLLGLTFFISLSSALALKPGVVIITEKESRQPDAKYSNLKGFGSDKITDGPIINFNKPSNGEEVGKPVVIDISFEPKNAPVDISTLEVTYLKLLSIDITDRVMEYAKPSGIQIANAEFPSGTHKVKFAIKDSEGKLSESVLKVTILDD